ncbi:MAG: PDZ domain-containing protein [Planctomycetia bacterium]|nr:PDZ domain-containing protein [Planctomycetia bacterium]
MRACRFLLVASLVSVVFLCAGRGWAADDDDEEKAPAQTEPKAEPAAAPAKNDQYFELMRVFADTFEQIDRNYVKDVDRRKLIEAALRGMMDELDPYSNYISPEDQQRFTEQIEQEFTGIGIQVQPDPQTRRLTVTSPLPGTPAYKAGIQAGDTIMEINGKSAEKMTVNDAVKVLRGKEGEEVTIGIIHPGKSQIERLTMARAKITMPTVLGDAHKTDGTWNFMIDPEKKIGYVRLTAFSRNTAAELKKALGELTSDGVKGLILDLRFNPGGLLNSAVDICDMFLKEGKIVSTKGRNTEERPQYARPRPGKFKDVPMAILVNRYSASASEIVSAALQDHKRAIVVGERTWGKGSVQNVIKLEEGKSQLKLTTASYHRPSGKNIHRFPDSKETDEWGVMPDDKFAVQFSGPEQESYLEYRRSRDVLSKDGPPKSDFQDKQLAKAVEFLTEKLAGDKKPEGDAKPEADKTTAKAEGKPDAKSPEPKKDASKDKEGDKKPEEKQPEPKADAGTVRDLRPLQITRPQFVILPAAAA